MLQQQQQQQQQQRGIILLKGLRDVLPADLTVL